MTSQELRQKYLDFFVSRGHTVIDPAKLVLENDPTTLFTSAGMQPLIPYLLGKDHESGSKRLVNSQPCFRAQDINEVGDSHHTTFFEMLGNWSLGDYFKKDQLPWIWEFLTKEVGLNPEKLHITLFEGSDLVPKDMESFEIWKSLGVSEDHIHFYGDKKNWWSRSGAPEDMPVGEPGGTDSEVFYEFSEIEHNDKFGDVCHPNCDCGRFLEICNSVFIQYQKTEDGSLKELEQKNVDFGGGLERILAAANDDPDVFETDLFMPIIEQISKDLGVDYEEHRDSIQVIADHIKASIFLIKEGVVPSNKMHGYIVRRLLRRAATKAFQINKDFGSESFKNLIDLIMDIYPMYFNGVSAEEIEKEVSTEILKFRKTIENGLKEVEKIEKIDGKIAFDLFQNFGFPFEVTEELFKARGQEIDKSEFDEEFKKHQEASRVS